MKTRTQNTQILTRVHFKIKIMYKFIDFYKTNIQVLSLDKKKYPI